MPELSRFLGIIIAMYSNDHNPPHFHVLYNEYDAEIEIKTKVNLNTLCWDNNVDFAPDYLLKQVSETSIEASENPKRAFPLLPSQSA